MGPVGRGQLPFRGASFPLVHLVLPVIHSLVGPAVKGIKVLVFRRELVVGHGTVGCITALPHVKPF